jgi:hypothetical protein
MKCFCKCVHGKCQGKNEIDTSFLYNKLFNVDNDCELCTEKCTECEEML